MVGGVPDSSEPVLGAAGRSLLGEVESSVGLNGIGPSAFHPLATAGVARNVAAIDGGNSVVADFGACGVVAVRAGYTLRRPEDAYDDHVTLEQAHLVAKRSARAQWEEFVRPYEWGAGLDPPTPSGAQWIRGWCEAERAVAEVDAARRALRHLSPGDILLLDGSLEAELPQARLLDGLLQACRAKSVDLVGVTKDTSLSIGGTLPFTLELEEAARESNAPAAFSVDVTDLLGRAAVLRTFGVRWDARSPVYRVDVAAPPGHVEDVLGFLSHICNDVAYPGYPYALARIHDRVHYSDHEGGDLKRELEAVVARGRGHLFSLRLFGRGRDVLTLGG